MDTSQIHYHWAMSDFNSLAQNFEQWRPPEQQQTPGWTHSRFVLCSKELKPPSLQEVLWWPVKRFSIVTAVAPVAAVVQVRSLAWKLPRAAGTAKKKNKKQNLPPKWSPFLWFASFPCPPCPQQLVHRQKADVVIGFQGSSPDHPRLVWKCPP